MIQPQHVDEQDKYIKTKCGHNILLHM